MTAWTLRNAAAVWAALALGAILSLGGACARQDGRDALLGKWRVTGVEEKGRFVSVKDKVALARIPGAAGAASQDIELKANGDYLVGPSRARWRLLGPRTFGVTYRLHSGETELPVEFALEEGGLKLRRPQGAFWIVLRRP